MFHNKHRNYFTIVKSIKAEIPDAAGGYPAGLCGYIGIAVCCGKIVKSAFTAQSGAEGGGRVAGLIAGGGDKLSDNKALAVDIGGAQAAGAGIQTSAKAAEERFGKGHERRGEAEMWRGGQQRLPAGEIFRRTDCLTGEKHPGENGIRPAIQGRFQTQDGFIPGIKAGFRRKGTDELCAALPGQGGGQLAEPGSKPLVAVKGADGHGV